MEDVGYAEGEAEDYAEDAGPEGVVVLACVSRVRCLLARVPLAVYTYATRVSRVFCDCIIPQWRGKGIGSSLLKLRDLNSSARVMMGEYVRVWWCGRQLYAMRW